MSTVAEEAATVVFGRYEDVAAALAHPDLVPLPAAAGAVGGVAGLRAAVARFSAGEAHRARRALVEADLAGLDPAALRASAAAGVEPDARLRVVRALAQGLGLAEPDAVARAVAVVARAYFTGTPQDAEADAAVDWLLPRMGVADGPAEHAANRIGLLVQACDATAALVAHARRAGGEEAAGGAAGASPDVADVADVLDRTLHQDPPVAVMRRVAVHDAVVGGTAVAAGTQVLLDIAAAQQAAPGRPPLTFGAPPRLCPGRTHALALAAGILSAPATGPVGGSAVGPVAPVAVGPVPPAAAASATRTEEGAA
ncbi:hypothetical protein OH807_22400 [Kitasatospora sp. NBC_01560]|uniref:hypothetical protein n=1 Tax=Kitasatospora sp. NBC_01560 TaxID=2975965 RepID=UPI00387006BF